jgi:hypothetical protein
LPSQCELRSSFIRSAHNEVLNVKWPDGKGGTVSFGRDDIGEWFEAVAKEIDRRFPGGSP